MFKKNKMDIIPSYEIEEIYLIDYNLETRNIILSNFKNYTKLKKFNCYNNNLTELPSFPKTLIYLKCYENKLTKLPNLPYSLMELYCHKNKLTELPDLPNSLQDLRCNDNKLPDLPNSLKYLYYNNNFTYLDDKEIKTINETNSKNRIIKRMKILNRTLLLEHSARICMNPKRIKRLLDTNEIDFYDGSFDTLTS